MSIVNLGEIKFIAVMRRGQRSSLAQGRGRKSKKKSGGFLIQYQRYKKGINIYVIELIY